MPISTGTNTLLQQNGWHSQEADAAREQKINGHAKLQQPSVNGNATAVPENIAATQLTSPIKYSGSLDSYAYNELTPAIGREYTTLQLSAMLAHPQRDLVIRDFASQVSQRGMIVLRGQDTTPNAMRDFITLLSNLAGSPASSGLHVHPLTEEGSELGDQVSVISSTKQRKGGGLTHRLADSSRFASAGWHSDITFEPVPSDYAMLKIHTLPPTGGDTLWASATEIYKRLSPPMATFLSGLTATHDASFFHDEARRLGNPLRAGQRGSPLNQGRICGPSIPSFGPTVRLITSYNLAMPMLTGVCEAVTGEKSVFVNRGFTKRINGVTKDESDLLLRYLFDLVTHNHDAQVRLKWRPNDLAIWDNRCTWHTATYDYDSARAGDRVCSLGEAPFLTLP